MTLQKRLGKIFVKQEKKLELSKRKKNNNSILFSKMGDTKLLDAITSRLALAGLMLKADEFLTIWVFIFIIPTLLGYMISRNIIVTAAVAIIAFCAPILYVKYKTNKRLALFNTQLGDSLIIISNCLRSGLTFQQSLESISNEMPDPIALEFSRVLREIKFGSNLEHSLSALAERIGNQDLDLMVSAILIQRQVGGNLSVILDNISSTIIDRIKIKSEIKTLTATGRISGLIVGLLPIGISLILMITNPDYMSVLFNTTLGISLLSLSVFLEIIGFLFISKISNIEY
ncbi:MAG: type II secretion system F family protein [Oscillospiraceae bacterium]|nr:type II secretion system F family protein [Oscillospiraceae bacterium]